ncbi:MAG: hypothetical protein ACRC68_07555 [Clostridium sp.]
MTFNKFNELRIKDTSLLTESEKLAKAMNENIIPEYKCNSFLDVYDGAELYQIDKNGIETLIAVFNEIDGRFVLIK